MQLCFFVFVRGNIGLRGKCVIHLCVCALANANSGPLVPHFHFPRMRKLISFCIAPAVAVGRATQMYTYSPTGPSRSERQSATFDIMCLFEKSEKFSNKIRARIYFFRVAPQVGHVISPFAVLDDESPAYTTHTPRNKYRVTFAHSECDTTVRAERVRIVIQKNFYRFCLDFACQRYSTTHSERNAESGAKQKRSRMCRLIYINWNKSSPIWPEEKEEITIETRPAVIESTHSDSVSVCDCVNVE